MTINLLADDYQADRCKGIAAIMLRLFPMVARAEIEHSPYTYLKNRWDGYTTGQKKALCDVLELPFQSAHWDQFNPDQIIFIVERFKLRLKQSESIDNEFNRQTENQFFGVAA